LMTLKDDVSDALLAGLLLDAREQIVLVLLSEDAVGISVSRYDVVPEKDAFREGLNRKVWIVVFREAGEEVFVSSARACTEGGDEYPLNSPQERESVQFAMEVAMGAWPEWCPHLRDSVFPRSPIIIHRDTPVA